MTNHPTRPSQTRLAPAGRKQTTLGDGLADSLGLKEQWVKWKVSHEERGCGDLRSCRCECDDHGCKDIEEQPFQCHACRDTGWAPEERRSIQFGSASLHYAAKPCDQCNVPENVRLRYHQLCSAIPFEWFDRFRLDKLPVQRPPRNVAEQWRNNAWRTPFLLIVGRPGTGKTHCAIGVAGEWIKEGKSVFYATASDLLDAIKATFESKDSTSEDYLRPAKASSLFILDDLGNQPRTEWSDTILFNILNYRMMNKLATIITSNKDPNAEDFAETRLRSRVTGKRVSTVITMPHDAPDYRNVTEGNRATNQSKQSGPHEQLQQPEEEPRPHRREGP